MNLLVVCRKPACQVKEQIDDTNLASEERSSLVQVCSDHGEVGADRPL